MRFKIKNYNQINRGQAVIIVTLFTVVIATAIIGGIVAPAIRESTNARDLTYTKQSYFLAEAGVEDAAYRLKNGLSLSATEVITLASSTATTTIADLGGGNKSVTASSSVQNSNRILQVNLNVGSGAAFHYGVQVGAGGLRMENSSSVIGSVYSAGDVTGGGTGSISGDVFVASTSVISDAVDIGGSAWAHAIDHTTIAKNATTTTVLDNASVGAYAYGNTITHSTITKNAYYTTSQSSNAVSGSIIQKSPAPTDLPVIDLPIADSQITDWETQAAAGGTYAGSCPYNISSGSVTLGPKKIPCDLNISNTAVVTIAGPIWVVGDINLGNSAILQLAASYGSKGEAVIADNASNRTSSSQFAIANSAQILGTASKGYPVIVSMNNYQGTGDTNLAIKISNSSSGAVYYAPYGILEVSNSTNLKEAVAYQIHMTNSATLTYETGLANMSFSAGPSGGYDITKWQEVQ